MDIEKLSWIKASNYRQEVLSSLESSRKTPKEISRDTEYYLSHVSKTLSDLTEKELATCLTPEKRKGKLFELTPEGEKILNEL